MPDIRIGLLALAVIAVLPGPLRAEEVLPVRAGVDTPMLTHTLFREATCTAGPMPIMVVRTAPAHGTLHAEKVSTTLRDGACAGKVFKSLRVSYRSAPGYRGPDRVVFEIQTEVYMNDVGTRASTHDISIRVR